jgi:TonB family protein
MKKFIVVSFLFLFLGIITDVQAQGTVTVIKAKTITGEVRWSGNILLRGDVVVAPSGHLQISPGTRIMFAPNSDVQHSGFDKTRAELIVKGTIFSKGTINRKIVFTSASDNPRMQDWAGIVILNGNRPAVFEFSVVEYAYNGIDIKKSNPVIQNCQIQFNYNAGVKIAVRSKAKLIGNIIRDNGYAGVICETGAQPVLTDNLITKNQIGIIAFGSSRPNLGDLQKGASFNPGRNALFDNLEYDVYNHSANDIKAEGNSWGSKDLKTIMAHIYDKNDADRFGTIDFNPIIGNVNLFKKMLLAQQPQPSAAKDTSSASAETGAAGVSSVPPAAQKFKSISEQSVSSKKIAGIDTTRKAKAFTPPKAAVTVSKKDSSLVNKPKAKPAAKDSIKTTLTQKPEINYNQVFLDVFLDRKVKVLKEVKPIVDDPSKGMYEHGRIVVRVVVSKNGTVERAKILRGLNYYYDQLALDAAMKFRFAPGTVKGVPVRYSTSILFKF